VPPIGTSAVQTTKASLLYRQNKRNSLEGFKGIGPDNDAYRWGFSAERQEKLDRPVLSIEVCVKVDLSRERSKTLGSHLQGTDSNTAN